MDFARLQSAWQDMGRAPGPGLDVDQLVRRVLSADRRMSRRLLVRDLAELATAAGLAGLMFWMAAAAPVRWPWLGAGGLFVMLGLVFLVERLRRGARGRPGDSLRQRLAGAVADADHQIALLRSVAWWYLLPCGAAVALMLAGIALGARGSMSEAEWRLARWLLWAAMLVMVPVVGALYYWIWRANQLAIDRHLRPHRRGLAELLDQLNREGGTES
jgi:hypothetical protein